MGSHGVGRVMSSMMMTALFFPAAPSLMGLVPMAAWSFSADLRLGQRRGVIAVDPGDVYVPVIRERDRDRPVAVVAVGGQIGMFS